MTNIYHATPYDISATGFYFTDYDDYRAKAASHRNAYGDPVEEYEIQFIDGDNPRLFKALGVNQASLKEWFDEFEDMDETDAIKAISLIEDFGYEADTVLEHLDDLCLFEGTAVEYAEHYLEESGLLSQVPESLRYYIDTEAMARDMVLGGDITELRHDGQDYVAWGV